MATLILSYPGADFRPDGAAGEGAAPPSSSPEPRGLAYAAMGQWLQLCDHITRAGGRILILDPPPPAASSAGAGDAAAPPAGAVEPVYAGRLGAAFLTPGTLNTPIFLRGGAYDGGGPIGEDSVSRAISKAGLQVRPSRHRFQGQLDVIPIDRNRYILTYGQAAPASCRASLEEVKGLLPLGAQTLEVELRPPCTAGAQGLAYLTAPSGAKVLLVDRGALLSHTPEELLRFAGSHVEYFVLSAEDARAGATECLALRGTLILAPGSSTILRGQLARRGFQLVETDVSLLLGGRPGGPRILANELPGLVLSDDAPSYAWRRDELLERRASYKGRP